ncbi:Stp1/IreP family PP2C-type Ser/Thr phosphatase [Sanguibacter sp. Leaf3]|uniref:Stp1/IreP family PP2C-type Ser/Thr phosphatase n=1 Tax=Sanguibacter sp. Leaf3 TaxID=1736209 RepID=UPI0006FEA398|nr:Stp1/IreP family PP2C-type Ser/Thr phosphatase [Sanguibacter sp. Leaf3]KQT96252.1 serine/threonine protein phosphatase [Sanguibacter sp. Leaf3]
MTIALRYAALSDVGLVRSNNQDSAYAGPHLLLVADGMGGHAGGDIASSLAVASLAPLDGEAFGSSEILERLGEAIETARLELVRRAREDSELSGMGTTVTALLRSGNKLAMAHMGDSRGYLLRGGQLSQVTKDHTFVQHLVDTGKITAEEAEHHPQRSVVMRVLGDFDLDLSPDLSVREAHPGDRWLLCSDGLSGMVSLETIERTMVENTDVTACAERLVQLALRAGGSDNITCIVADVLDLDDLPDGAAPDSGVQVVGSVAITRDAPTTAVDGPAARAAALLAEARATVGALAESSQQSPAAPDAAVSEPDETVEVATATPGALSRSEKKAARAHERADAKAAKAEAKRGTGISSTELEEETGRGRWAWTLVSLVVLLAIVGTGAFFGYRWTQTQYYVGLADGKVTIFQGISQSIGPLELSEVYETSDVVASDLDRFEINQLERTIRAKSLDDARQRVADLAPEGAATDEPATEGTGETPTPTDGATTAAADAAPDGPTTAGGTS